MTHCDVHNNHQITASKNSYLTVYREISWDIAIYSVYYVLCLIFAFKKSTRGSDHHIFSKEKRKSRRRRRMNPFLTRFKCCQAVFNHPLRRDPPIFFFTQGVVIYLFFKKCSQLCPCCTCPFGILKVEMRRRLNDSGGGGGGRPAPGIELRTQRLEEKKKKGKKK